MGDPNELKAADFGLVNTENVDPQLDPRIETVVNTALKGNKYMELLSTSNKYLMDQWKMHNSVQKEYDVLTKTYVYNVGGKTPVPQMCLPKDKKQKLKLYFPLLVLQLYFPVKANLLCDIGITLCNSQRKRITLSSNQKSRQTSSLFTVLPFTIENSNKWINILVDIEDIVAAMWNNLKLKEIDFLSLSGVFLLKRVFLLSRDLINFTEGVFVIKYDQLPKQMSFPKNATQHHEYVSSSYNSLEKCVKARNFENEGNICSSRNSSRSSISNGQIKYPKVNPLTTLDGNMKFATNSLTKPSNLGKYEMLEDALNLSMSVYSEETELKAKKEFNQHILPVHLKTETSSSKDVPSRAKRDIELWIPLLNDSQKKY